MCPGATQHLILQQPCLSFVICDKYMAPFKLGQFFSFPPFCDVWKVLFNISEVFSKSLSAVLAQVGHLDCDDGLVGEDNGMNGSK